jgi:hypothetical protein
LILAVQPALLHVKKPGTVASVGLGG